MFEEWILCPICRSKTRNRIREDTVLKTILSTARNAGKCARERLESMKELCREWEQFV